MNFSQFFFITFPREFGWFSQEFLCAYLQFFNFSCENCDIFLYHKNSNFVSSPILSLPCDRIVYIT
jgi:hypothetical protein